MHISVIFIGGYIVSKKTKIQTSNTRCKNHQPSSKTLTAEQVDSVFGVLVHEKNIFGEPCLLIAGVDPKTGANIYRPNMGLTKLLELFQKYESKPEFKLTIEALLAEMMEKCEEELDLVLAELNRRNQPLMLTKINSKTGERMYALNTGNYKTKGST